MSLDVFILVFTSLINVALGSLVLLRNYRDKANVSFFLISFFIAAWTVTNYLTDNTATLAANLSYARLANFTAYQIIFWILLFSNYFPRKQKRPKWDTPFLLVVFFAGAILPFLKQSIVSITANTGVAEQELGILYPVFILLMLGIFIKAFVNLLKSYHSAQGRVEAQRIKYVTAGLTASFILGLTANAVIPAITGNWEVSRFGPIFTTILVAFMTVSIIRHRLFDIRLVVARSIAYILLLLTLGSAYGITIFAVSNAFFGGQTLSGSQQAVYITLAIFLAFTFQPLRHFFEKFTDKIFYRDRYETQQVINRLSSVLASQIDINAIAEQSLEIIGNTLKLTHAQLVVLDEGKLYRNADFGKKQTPVPVSALEQLRANLIIADEQEGDGTKRFMQEHEIAASLRLKTQEGIVGYVLLGAKQSGGVYSDQDARLLEIIANELAIALQNARSFEKIADFNVTLQERIKEATKRLAQQNQRLKELDEAKDEFISMASHQLRTPLTAIKGYISMLSEGDAGKLNQKQFEFADLAYTSAERMVYLISDMLNVSRINTGKLVIDRAPTDLVKVVKSEILQLKRTAEARKVKLQFSEPKQKIPSLSLDEGKMRQVIMNYLDNAVYYAPDSTVEIALEKMGDKIRFTVRDHGIGVPKAEQQKLFTKFYRAGNAKKARPDGTGLGLYMAKIVIEMQGGDLLFSSQEGKGSTFGFELPVAQAGAKAAKKSTKPAAVEV